VRAFSGVVAGCVPEGKLTGQVLGVGYPVHVQVSGYIESVRKIVEVTVTVAVGGMGDVGGGVVTVQEHERGQMHLGQSDCLQGKKEIPKESSC
jgi:hypothetical protein